MGAAAEAHCWALRCRCGAGFLRCQRLQPTLVDMLILQVIFHHEGQQHTVEPLRSAAAAALVLDVLTGEGVGGRDGAVSTAAAALLMPHYFSQHLTLQQHLPARQTWMIPLQCTNALPPAFPWMRLSCAATHACLSWRAWRGAEQRCHSCACHSGNLLCASALHMSCSPLCGPR